ncbi:MAG: ABC transporter ATP-binding protein [Actinomycetota bacterium]|nr:ABC transporter ATP-binding protein [Actinomycetota bacterium]
MSQAPPLLELREVQAGYGPFRALFGVSLSVREGSVVALLGSNGCGKTTVARVCTGLIKPTEGKFFFDGEDVTRERAYRLARRGIAHAPEGRSVFASLTVEENLLLTLRRSLGRSKVAGGLARAYEMFPPLGRRRRQTAGTLSGGEQRMLALARVLANPPRLLVCDELSLGLAPIVVDEVYNALATIRDAGTTLLIVEQHVSHALDLADDVAVLVKGRITYDGAVADMGDLSERLLPSGTSVEAPSPNGQ